MGSKGSSRAMERQSEAQLSLMREQLELAKQQAAKPPSPNPPIYSGEEEDVNAEAANARRKERRRLRCAVNTTSTLLSDARTTNNTSGKTLLGE